MKIEISSCPNCSRELDGATDPFGDAVPKEGDATVCIYCKTILVFGKDLKLEMPNLEQIKALAGNKAVLAIMKALEHIEKETQKGDNT